MPILPIQQSAPPAYDPRVVPRPPRLHWAVLLLLQIVTLGLFSLIWLTVQAAWVKRITGRSTALIVAIVNLCSVPCLIVATAIEGPPIGELNRLLIIAINLGTIFTLQSALESFPIDMSLSGAFTFFFGTIYFQYHMNDYTSPDAVDVFGPLETPAYVPATSPEPSR